MCPRLAAQSVRLIAPKRANETLVTHKLNKPSNPAWWQSQIGIIKKKQTAYLRQHLPAFRADHDDLIGDTLLALTRQLQERATEYPSSWYEQPEPRAESDKSYLHKLATIILKRRIADLIRNRRREMRHLSIDDEPHEGIVDLKAEPPDRRILIVTLLKTTSLVLDEMSAKDRDLIALAANKDVRRALNPRDRKRLERIRKELRNEISRRLGADVHDLLTNL